MTDGLMGWLIVAVLVLALFSALRFDLLRLLWREMLKLGGSPPARAEPPPESHHATRAAHLHEAPPQKPPIHRSGSRHSQ